MEEKEAKIAMNEEMEKAVAAKNEKLEAENRLRSSLVSARAGTIVRAGMPTPVTTPRRSFGL